MELTDYFRRVFDYNAWANREALSKLLALPQAPERSRKFIAHIVAAEWLWLRRLKAGKEMEVWPKLTLEECSEEFQQLEVAWERYLGDLASDQLAREISYINSKGESWKNSVADVLTHVTMHSAYHRGQIASDMRQAGHTPAYTDFIHCVRQGFLAAK
jgi:uncharacterized damage-inducible protein DinB